MDDLCDRGVGASPPGVEVDEVDRAEKDKAKTRRQQAGKKAFQEGILPGGPREQRLALLSFESKARGGVEGRARARSTIDKPPNGPTFIAPWSPC